MSPLYNNKMIKQLKMNNNINKNNNNKINNKITLIKTKKFLSKNLFK